MYVYGLTSAGNDVEARGIGDVPVSTVEHGELAAIVSRVGDASLRAKRRDLLRHSDVLQAAFAHAAVVPLRFGVVFDSEDALVADLLGARYEELVTLLQRIDGLAELRLRASFVERELLAEIVREDSRIAALRGTPGAGQVELGEAVAHAVAAKRAAATEALLAAVGPLALEMRVDEPRDEYEVIRGSFLVDRRGTTAVESAADDFARNNAGRMQVELIGPMPPHSFVGLEGGG